MKRIAAIAAVWMTWVVLGCGSGNPGWEASGVVRELFPDESQVKIEHGDIADLMPAMTMSFEVDDPALLEGLAPGQFVKFRLEKRERGYVIVALDAPQSRAGVAKAASSGLLDVRDPAPGFELVDQDGRTVTLESLRGAPVLVDFIFTRCPGPCPILTGLHEDVRAALGSEARRRARFVSITLDPAHDTPAVLAGYAHARRIDTEGWSFLTGAPDTVDAVVRAWGVGSTRRADGEIDHTVATFLIDAEGRIARRYLGTSHLVEELRQDIETLLF